MKNNRDPLPTCIFDKGSSVTDPSEIANTFNTYFSSIGEILQSKIHSSHIDFKRYLKNPNMHSFFVSPTDNTEISNLISRLKNGKASGPNSIPTVVLKHLNSEISIILADLFNLSFSTGVFPDILKISSVSPLFKKDSKLACGNYRAHKKVDTFNFTVIIYCFSNLFIIPLVFISIKSVYFFVCLLRGVILARTNCRFSSYSDIEICI